MHAHVPALNALGRERAEGSEVLREPDRCDDLAEVLRRAHRHDPKRRAGRRVRPDCAAHDAHLQRRPARRPRSAPSAGGRRARGEDGVACKKEERRDLHGQLDVTAQRAVCRADLP